MAKKQKKSKFDRAYETFLKILMWVLITFVAYVLVNVSIKTIVPLLHLDGSLPMKNGKVIADETELIHNQGTSAHPRYFSYGKVRPIPGYKRETESLLADSNESDFLFRREEGTQGPDQIYFAVTTKEAETAAEEARERILGFYQNAEAQMLEKCRGTAGEYIKFTYTYRKEDGSDCYGCNVYLTGKEKAVLIAMLSGESCDWNAEIEKVFSGFTSSAN